MNKEAIARIAYRLWQESGQPEGQSERFWYAAEDICRQGTTRRGWPPQD